MKIGVVDDGVDQRARVPRPDRDVVPARVPEGRQALDDAEGDRRARLPGARLGPAADGCALDREASFHGTHVAGIAAGGRARPRPGGPDHPAGREPLRRRSRTRGSATTASSTSRRGSATRRTRPRSWPRSRPRCATGWTSSTSPAAARETEPGERRDDRDDSQRGRRRRRPGDRGRELARRVRPTAAVGSPGTAPDAITVAASSNVHVFAPSVTRAGRACARDARELPFRTLAARRRFPRLGHARPDARRRRLGHRHRRAARRPPALRRHAPERARHDASARLAPGNDRARLPRRLRDRHQGDPRRCIGRRDGHDARRQPAGRADRAPARHPGRHDRRPRRRAPARLPRLGRRQRGSPVLVRPARASHRARRDRS